MLIDKLIEVLMLRWTQDPIISFIYCSQIFRTQAKLGERTQFIFHKSFEETILLKSNKKFSLFKLGKNSNKFHIIREQMLSSSLVRFSSFILPHSLLSMSERPTQMGDIQDQEALSSSTKQKTHKAMQKSKTKYSKLGWFLNHRSHACFWRCLSLIFLHFSTRLS